MIMPLLSNKTRKLQPGTSFGSLMDDHWNTGPTVSQNSELEDESLPNSQGKYLRINQSRLKLD